MFVFKEIIDMFSGGKCLVINYPSPPADESPNIWQISNVLICFCVKIMKRVSVS